VALDPPVAANRVALANRFDRVEWVGAFRDLGTLIPFAVAYIAVVKVQRELNKWLELSRNIHVITSRNR